MINRGVLSRKRCPIWVTVLMGGMCIAWVGCDSGDVGTVGGQVDTLGGGVTDSTVRLAGETDTGIHLERDDRRPSPPSFSHTAGVVSSAFDLVLRAEDEGQRIIYTVDGSQPTPLNLQGTTFSYKNRYPGELEHAEFVSLEYDGPIRIENRTPQMEVMAGFSTDYDGYHTSSSDERLFKGTVVRAVVIGEDGVLSREATRSYFVDDQSSLRYSLPVMSLAIQADHFFDYDSGIYTPGRIWDEDGEGVRDGGAPANYHQRGDEWERYGHLEFFNAWGDEVPVFRQNVGVRLHGGWSRSHPMKSLRLYARERFSAPYFETAMFPDLPFERYKRLLLRNSGNDWSCSLFRDAAIQSVMTPLRVDTQAYRPLILFVNGEYWGIHNMRERYDSHYLERTWGVPEGDLELMTNEDTVKEGDGEHYFELIDYMKTYGVSLSEHYDYVQTQMDVENFIDFQIAHIFARNTDWPGNNIDFWRYRTTAYRPDAPPGHDGRWRWMLFDTDFGFGIWDNDAFHDTLSFAAEAGVTEWPNPDWSTFVLRTLLTNFEFRQKFISRFADLLNTAFLPDRTVAIIRGLQRVLAPEMPEHIRRWKQPRSMNDWTDEVDKMVDFVTMRPELQRTHILSYFDLEGVFRLQVDVSDSALGYVRVNSVDIGPQTGESRAFPWEGDYFDGVPVTVEAIPHSGHSFSHWEGASETGRRVTVEGRSDTTVSLVAVFL